MSGELEPDFILISPHDSGSFSVSGLLRMASQVAYWIVPEKIQRLIEHDPSLAALACATCVAITIACALGPTRLCWEAIDRFHGLYELLRQGRLIHSIDLSRMAAAVRGEDGMDECQDHLSPNAKPVQRPIRRTIREAHPVSSTPGTDATAPTTRIGTYYPGLVNSSTNSCFLNAVLQSLASMPHVIQYLDLIRSYSHAHTPVITALREMLLALNTPREFKAVLRPYAVAQALLRHGIASGQMSMLFNEEQQDAQEFFVTVVDAIEAETKTLAENLLAELACPSFSNSIVVNRDRNTSKRVFDRNQLVNETSKIRRSPFRALMASRVACATCQFTSAIRHSEADHFSLNVPPKVTCRLEECLAEYTKLELLEDYICRKCSLIKTREILNRRRLETTAKKKLQTLKKQISILDAAIKEDPERELDERIVIERVASVATTKQTMFARPPDSLTFHISRSTAYARGVSFKNHCQVTYPELLHLDDFCTTPKLERAADQPISTFQAHSTTLRYRYRLSSVVVHYGSHSFGHYITFRRAPPLPGDLTSLNGGIWYRISDETVHRSSVQEALMSNPFLLMYERVEDDTESEKKEEQSVIDMAREISWWELE
ncbi:hypothetical protein CROQUDRAFT_715716 [Cronartium quercuum f. sp. fusiforme G11]|uniref:ubiquitinyl hydrolase 1 n=1 Tax=Cronartium quercuum f. sp. fusiforme G11 TaxID=708437 RepID=A0A9P6TC03_9BASI|nr:hypothetical protein CROQUDRAFT_715716 [Cronartium quercuum f. sp. fusiforme G11]